MTIRSLREVHEERLSRVRGWCYTSSGCAFFGWGQNKREHRFGVMHENLQRRERIEGSSDRSFGLTFAAFFALVAFLPLLRSSHQPRWWAASIAIVFALLALLWPKRLAVPNRLWLRFGLLLHAVISPIVLALLFYAAIVPIGLLKRIFGNDALRLRADRAADSYWITRDSSDSVPGSMKHQF